MASVLRGSARTTPRVRAELQAAQASSRALAAQYGLNPEAVLKWRNRKGTAGAAMGPKPRSAIAQRSPGGSTGEAGARLTEAEEAIIVELRRTLLPLDDVLGCPKDQIPKPARSALHRCLARHGISRLPRDEEAASKRKAFKETEIGYAHIDSAQLRSAEGKAHMFLAIDRVTKPCHPWTSGQAEHMNRTVEDATTEALHHSTTEAPRAHVIAFVSACNFAKHLKALRWRTPFQTIRDAWNANPNPFKVNPHHLTQGPSSLGQLGQGNAARDIPGWCRGSCSLSNDPWRVRYTLGSWCLSAPRCRRQLP